MAIGPAVPLVQRGLEGVAVLRLGKVQHAGGAAGQGGPGAGLPVIRRLPFGPLVHLKVSVGVDKSGKNQLAPGVDDLTAAGGEGGANLGDLACLHPQIGLYRAVGEDQGAVLNQDGHK